MPAALNTMCKPPKVSRLLDHGEAVVEFGDRAVIRRGITTGCLDLVDDLLGWRLVRTLTAAAGPGIVDHDLGAVRGHQLGDLGADPATRSSAQRDSPFEHAHSCDPQKCR